MLSSIRQHAKGWLGITLLALIAIPFAFTGVYSYMTGGGAVTVATVNDREIGQRDYANAYQSYRQRLQGMLGANFRPGMFEEQALRREALDRLIEEIVLVDAALEHGYRVGATQLAQRITSTPEFQTGGRFDRDLYLARIAQLGLSPEQYEQELRSQMLVEQMLGGLGMSSFVTDDELAEALRLQLQRRNVSYLVIPPADTGTLPEPDEAELAAFYAENGARFAQPEQVRLDYLDLSVERLASTIGAPDDATLKRLYEEEKSRLASDEELRARHILIELPADADEAARMEALERAEALRDQLVEGADFAELARAQSEDPGSAADGGDLGYFGRGLMDPAFENAAFALKVDEISEPVRSAFGYHLIQVTDVRGEAAADFAEMRDTLEEIYRRREAEQAFFDRSETLANLAYEHPDSLDAAAEALDLTIQQSPWLARDEVEAWPLAEPRVLAVAFSPEVLDEGLNSEVLELADGRLLVLRVAERKPARQPALDEVRDEVVASYQVRRASELARERGEALLKRLESGATVEEVASEAGLEPVSVKGMRRDSTAQPLPIVRTAFRLPQPEAGNSSAAGVAVDGGGFALVQLHEVVPGEPESEGDETRLREALARVHASAELAGVVDGARGRASIEINEESL